MRERNQLCDDLQVPLQSILDLSRASFQPWLRRVGEL